MAIFRCLFSDDPLPNVRCDERGVVLLEFAIAATLYFFMIFTLFEFALQFQKHLTISDIMRQASREAVVKEQTGTCDDISNRAVSEFNTRLAQFGLSADRHGASVRSHHSDDGNGTSEDTLGVDLDIGMDAVSLVGSFFGSDDFAMNSHAFVPIEDVGDPSSCP